MGMAVRAPACQHMLRRIEAGRQLDHRGSAVVKYLARELGVTWLSPGGHVLACVTSVDGQPSLILRDSASGTTLRLDMPEGQERLMRVWPADDSSAVVVECGGPKQPGFWWQACQPTDMQPLGNAATKVNQSAPKQGPKFCHRCCITMLMVLLLLL